MTTESSGEWREERMYVLESIKELKAEQRRQIESETLMRQSLEVKAEKDIRAAHDKIRKLETSSGILSVKNWAMTAVISAGGVVLFELVKWVFFK